MKENFQEVLETAKDCELTWWKLAQNYKSFARIYIFPENMGHNLQNELWASLLESILINWRALEIFREWRKKLQKWAISCIQCCNTFTFILWDCFHHASSQFSLRGRTLYMEALEWAGQQGKSELPAHSWTWPAKEEASSNRNIIWCNPPTPILLLHDQAKGSHPLKNNTVLWILFTNGGGGSARFHTLIQKFKG